MNKKLSKLGISLLLGFFLSRVLNQEDFEKLQKSLFKKIHEVNVNLDNYFIELINLQNSDTSSLEKNDDFKIVNRIREIKQKLETNDQDEIADLIISNLTKEDD